ncbi:amidase [Silvibacterium dinghuense]|uniref:Amidase n=1 Tax=Silvibacterium dinghuense TaxID=1560006 RepID=A0A4V1NV28_9BACT|nr:amidase [Silvibacterium dinghuense]RXS94312.1 amidase [Silvibacterium dinghuense]GGH17005.1 amidase [Silvibacterium dinghuense]
MTVTFLSAREQLAMLRARKISSIELAEEHIRQIGQWNNALGAFIEFDAGRVREQAKRGASGPLAGLCLSSKATVPIAGYRCEIGSALLRGDVAEQDAEAVARLRSAGATLLGTTNCPEFLMAYETDNLLYGKTRNPWSLDHSAGGSSGGEAAAIAAGMSAGGLGSDSGGSVRVPAHFCGISALKPTPGRVPGRGHTPPCIGPFSILGAVGPMARTIGDVALLFEALAEQDRLDPASPPLSLREMSIESAKQVRIGWLEEDGLTPVTEETREAVRAAVQSLEAQGFHVEPFRPAALEEARQLWWKFFMQCGAMFYAPAIAGRQAELSPIFREFLHLSGEAPPLTATQLLDAWAQCDEVRGKLLAEMREYPILLLPACSVPAFRHGEREWKIDGQPVQYLDAMRYTQWFNLLAAPAAVVPVSQSRNGLPIGVQIAGRPFEDELVLTVAGCVDRAFGYRPPPLVYPAAP